VAPTTPKVMIAAATCAIARPRMSRRPRWVRENFSIASINMVAGTALLLFGVVFGAWRWFLSIESHEASTAGTVMLAGLPVLLGIQLWLSVLQHDVSMTPKTPLHRRLGAVRVMRASEDE